MKDWKKTLISPSEPIMEALRIIDDSALQIALVVDHHSKLLGVVTDGDIRRGILKGVHIDAPVSSIMYSDYTFVGTKADKDEIISIMREKELLQIPVLDEQGCVVGLKILVDMINMPRAENWVVLMAGGHGNRLLPLTNDCPKPLLKLNGKPILEIILENLIAHGFTKYFISVNYKAEMIEDHFEDGSKWGIDIEYLREEKALGTAGALGLLKRRPTSPFIVMNSDLLTNINFSQLLDFHKVHKAAATMCVRDYRFQVPFGVVSLDQFSLRSIDEKPTHNFFVNAGIYVLSPESLNFIPKGILYDMTALFQDLVKSGHDAVAFPIREYWLDIGRFDDFEKANAEFNTVFNNKNNKKMENV